MNINNTYKLKIINRIKQIKDKKVITSKKLKKKKINLVIYNH